MAARPHALDSVGAIQRHDRRHHTFHRRSLALSVVLAWWLCVCVGLAGAVEPVPQAHDIIAKVRRDTLKDVRLDANLYIPDGGELVLNIDVPREAIIVDNQAPAKVTRVYSSHADGVFGVGETIDVLVEFTSAVDVVGSPTLQLATGCHASSCHVREVQRLRCQGTVGKFAVAFDGQRVVNIPWDATTTQFANFITRMTKIDHVLVDYHQSDGSACTFFGNNITVTFESVNIDGVDGDLPEMTADFANGNGDGSSLGHVRLDATLSATAWEIKKGRLVTDRFAVYTDKLNPRTLRFRYTVQDGDNTTALDYANTDALMKSLLASQDTIQILNAGSTVAADTTLPPPKFPGDWERGMGSSLSANSAIAVDVSKPRITSISSPHEDGTFGIGEVFAIQVFFSLPVVVTGLPTIVLETGQVDRIIPFKRVTGTTNNIVEFEYIVQAKDTSPDLTYTGVTALQLNGGSIKRQSTAPWTDAVLTLPVNGEKGSLSWSKNIVIDTSNPKVVGVTSVTPDGTYTGGDTIQIQVAFDVPVVVTGTPQLMLSTGSVDLYPGSFVQVAPTPASLNTIVFPAVDHRLSTAQSQGLQFLIDGQVYTIASVNGDTVTMVENYVGRIVDPTNIGGPTIAIMSPGYRPANYVSGSGTTNLVFAYVVQQGDSSLDLDFVSTSSLQLNGGTIKRLSTTPFSDAVLTLATPGTAGSLSFSAGIVINTNSPRVLQVNAITRDGVYRAQDEIYLAVVFDLPVVIQSSASIKTTATAAEDHFAVYERGSRTTTIVFKFVCQLTDQVAVFDVADQKALLPTYGLSNGFIRRRSTAPLIPAILDLPATGLTTKAISIDQASAYVVDVLTTHEDALAGVGEVIDVTVIFSVAVDVDITGGTPLLRLTTQKTASYVSGGGSTILMFRYTVQADDPRVRLTYVDIYSLVPNGGIIRATATTNLAATLLPRPQTTTLSSQQNIQIDTSAPAVVDVSTRHLDGDYTVGDRLVVAVSMNAPVVVAPTSQNAGVPTLYLQLSESGNIATPASFVAANDEQIYFAVTIASGHSTANLAYPSQVSLRCVGNYGLNKDPTQGNALTPHGIEFQGRLFVIWSEKSGGGASQIRAKSLDVANPFALAWRHEDGDGATGRIQFDATRDATIPMVAALSDTRLFACWQERSSATGNPTQIRVALYVGGDISVLTRWRFIGRTAPATTVGINRDTTQSAASPHLVVHATKLYMAWHETVAASAATQIRVVVYNGLDNAPAWAFVDGNSALHGINYASTRAARNVRLVSCRSTLYAVWEEDNAAGVSQIRAASLGGTDAAPRWSFVDGNSATVGLNYDVASNARMPSIACAADSLLVVAWQGLVTLSNGLTRTRIRAKQLSLATTGASWRSADALKGLNFDSTVNAINVRLRIHPLSTSTLYAAWEEVNAATGKSQVRAALFTGGDTGSWQFLDGGSKFSTINDVPTQDAATPVLVGSSSSARTWYAVWQEMHATTQTTHVRTSLFRVSAGGGGGGSVWQSLHDRCILRRSTASSTPSNLLLPELNTFGALDFDRQLRVDTASPTVQNVSFVSSSNVMTKASAIQTVDVFNTGSLTQGQYKLSYDGEETVCIDWNAPAVDVKAAIEGIATMKLSVQVALSTSQFQDASRYTITFAFPATGLKPLSLIASSACAAWVCGGAAVARLPCNAKTLVQLNTNRNVAMRSGIVDALVQFSSPVRFVAGGGVATVPTLTLETGLIDTAATYTTRGVLRQFDVGTESPSRVLQGAFRLAYGDSTAANAMETTDCIDSSFESNADAEQDLLAKLLVIKAIRTIGIQSVSRVRRRNGFRYTVVFSKSTSSNDLVDLIPADASACEPFGGRTQTIDVQADRAIVQGGFKLSFEEETTACLSAMIRAKGPTNSMEDTLSRIIPNRVIPLQVVRDASLFGSFGHRYYVSFMSASDAVHPISVSTTGCAAFMCDDGNGGTIACTGVKVVVNAGFTATLAVTDTLVFEYTAQDADTSPALAVRDSAALVGNIFRQSLNPVLAATLAIPKPARVPSSIRILSSSEFPRVVKVFSSTVDDTYSAGDIIVIYVVFSAPVDVVGKPILELNSGGVAYFLTGSGTTTLEFRYKILAGENSADLNYVSQISLRTPGMFVYICVAGTADQTSTRIDADLTLPAVANVASLGSQNALVVQTAPPTIVSVSSSRTDTTPGGTGYGVGDIIDVVVTFSSEIAVRGTPKIALNSGGTATFTYGGYRQLLDIGVHAMYPVTSGQFAISYGGVVSPCVDFNDPNSATATSLKSRLLAYAELATIGIISVTKTAKKNGGRFVIVFDSTKVLQVPMSVVPVLSDVCAPLIPSSSDSSPDQLLERSSDTRVVFQYVVQENDASNQLDYVGTLIDMSTVGAAMQSRSRTPTVNADVTLPAAASPNRLGSLKSLAVDGSPVVVVDIVSDSDAGTYGVAFPPIASPPTVYPGEIYFRIIFSRPVKVVGAPKVELATGSLQANGIFLPNRFALFVTQPKSNEAAFKYHIQEGDLSANLAFASVNVLASAVVYCVSTSSQTLARTTLPRLLVSATKVLTIDATSVPTTVEISSPHPDGLFGAGEAIEIDVIFSKQVTLQTGLNRNHDFHARNPVAVEYQTNIFVFWTEWSSFNYRAGVTTSFLYLRVFDSTTLAQVPLVTPVASAINQLPNTFIEKVSATVWKGELYAAWDESGQLYCAHFNGLTAPVAAWTLMPNMGINKDLQMRASDAQLLVHNLQLMVVWREEVVVPSTGKIVGQIRVAQHNTDYDARLWIFHDGNHQSVGLNKNPRNDAVQPHAAVHRGGMYVAWSEYSDTVDAYQIVVARRYVQSRDLSVWQFLTFTGQPTDFYISSYRPRLAVRKKGFEDMSLFVSWYRDKPDANGKEVRHGEVLETAWNESNHSIPQQLAGSVLPLVVNTQTLDMVACGNSLFASWIQQSSSVIEAYAQTLRIASLAADLSVESAWMPAFGNLNTSVNHNRTYDVNDAALICSTASQPPNTMGVFWTEFDGISSKLRLRHVNIPQRLESEKNITWGETANGAPLLQLETGTNPSGFAFAIDRSGLTSKTLRFLYVVYPGHSSLDLDVLNQQALILNGANVRDFQGQMPDFTLFPKSLDPRSLSFNNQLVINTISPVVVDVTAANPSGEYGVGERIVVQVKFSLPVAVGLDGGPPLLYLRSDELHLIGYLVNPAVYISGSGSDTLVFEFISGDQDYCEVLDYFRADSLSVPPLSWIRRNATFPMTEATITLPMPRTTHSLSGNKQISIKPTQPTVVSVTSTRPDGVYYPGDVIPIIVTFTLPVVVYGAPAILLETRNAVNPSQAKYVSGNNSRSLTFEYSVVEGDASSDLDVVDDRGVNEVNYVQSLKLFGQSQIKRLSTTPVTDANVILPAPGLPGSLSSNRNLIIDTVRPKIVDVRTTTPDGTYDVGEVVEILVEFSKIVVVSSIPYLKLNILTPRDRTRPRTAAYQDGRGSKVLRFTYTVGADDSTGSTPLDTLDTRSFILRPLSVADALSQAAAQVLCKAAQPTLPANLTMPRPGAVLRADAVRSLVGNNRKIFVRTDGLRVISMEANVASGDVYAPGQRIVITVVFSGIVVVQGSPRLGLNANALLPTFTTYVSGSGSSKLLFEYIVATGDSVQVLEAASRKALELPAGSLITDKSGLSVPLRLGAPLLPASLSFNYKIGISSSPPVVQRVFINNMGASVSGDAFGVGDDIVIGVQFSRKIKLSSVGTPPPPTLLLQFNNGPRTASYVSGDATTTLLFSIRIAAGDSITPLEYASVNALITPAAPAGVYALATTLTLAAVTTLPAIGSAGSLSATSSVKVISSPPVVVSVASVDRDGTYGLGDRLRISIKFSYRVTVVLATSPCVLELFLGGNQASVASFVGGSTTNTLMFEYRVVAGDRSGRLDYRNTASLSCSVLQLSANPSLAADTTLPAPGSEGSLGYNARLRVDSVAPRIVSVSSALNNGIYGAGQVIDIVVSFSEGVEVVDPGLCNPRLRLSIANTQATPPRIPIASYQAGSGSAAITFRYTTVIGDMALPIGYDGVNALSTEPFAQCSFRAMTQDRRRASRYLPVPGGSGSLSNNKDIRIDAVEPPRVVSVSSAMADGIYTVGDVITMTVTFTTPVTVTGTPFLLLDTGSANGPSQAVYVSGSNSPTLTFSYTIQDGDHSDRLEYVRCPDAARFRPKKREFDKVVKCVADQNALQLGFGGAIKRSATEPVVDAVLDLPEVSLWPKLRVATSRQSFTYVNQLEDISDLPETERKRVIDGEYARMLANEVSISNAKTSINIYSNGIPSHATTLPLVEQRYFIELVRFPVVQLNPLSLKAFEGFIGIMLNGIPFKKPSLPVPPVLDVCGGAVDDKKRYYYADVPSCYVASLTQSMLEADSKTPFVRVGFAFDGMPVYYYFNETGQVPQQLDECNGIRGADGGYRYHLVPSQSNPFMPCLKAINDPDPISTPNVVNPINVFRFPVDIRQVEGLTLPSLSQFDGLVVDENPATVTGTATWLNPKGVSVVYTATSMIVRSTGIPSGQYGPFPNAYNRFVMREQDYVFQLPRQPVAAAQTTKLPVDTQIGVMLNGIPFFASQSSVYGGNVMDQKTQVYWMMDKCHGLVDAGGNYRYYGLPDCLLTELGGKLQPGKPSPLLGYALDGFPLYGPYGESGTAPTDLDACNGRIGDDGSYRYHATLDKAPYLIGCFKGTPLITSNDQVQRSLSYAKALRVNTQTPRVLQIFTNKLPGSYVLGETLDLVTLWSSPVAVDTTMGAPSIPVAGAQVQAIYSATKSTPLRTVFQYTVTAAEMAAREYNYDFRETIRLNGGSIKRAAATPTLLADLRLVWAEQNSRFASKHQLVKDVRITMRGLYHPYASDLSATLYHETQSASVFHKCCRDMAFGVPDKRLRINEEQIHIYANNPTSGVGWDYGFQDFIATANLARDGGATARQSTTSGSCYASNAIDGRVKGMVTSQDVARTDASPDAVAWWELRLVKPVEIGTIHVWLPQRPDRRPAVVQILRVDSPDGVSQVYGSFQLLFTAWDERIVSTAPINWNAVAMVRDENPKIDNLGIGKGESLEAKILAAIPATVTASQRLYITRSPADALASINGAFTWSITFMDDTFLYEDGAVPLAVDAANNNICDGLGTVTLARPFPGDDLDEWAYKSRDDDRRSDGKASMFPFWITLHEDTAVMNFETFTDALNASIWKFRVDERFNTTQMVSVNPPVGLKSTQFIRIVAEKPSAHLTLAEVDVFLERNHILSQYPGGTPITTEFYPKAETWSPEDSFQERFGRRTSEGRWSLTIQDAVPKQQPHRERDPIHGAGAISDWVLQITNLAGKTRTYYMDIKAQLKTLPRHGKLYVSIAQTDTEHLDRDRNNVLDLVEAERYLSSYFLSFNVLPSATRLRVLWNFFDGYSQNGGIEVLADPSERQKIYPSPVCDRQCLENLGVDPYYWPGTTGDRALKPMEIRRDRVVRYIPNPGFEGEDTLTYTITVGAQESSVRGTVELYVSQCRDDNCGYDLTQLTRERINP